MSLHLALHPPSSLTLLNPSHRFRCFSPKPHSLSFSSSPRRAAFSIRSSSDNPAYVDEWGDKSEPEPEPVSRFSATDPPKDDDEWGGGAELGNGTPAAADGDGKLWELKRALVDTVYGSDSGVRASAEVRAEALELVTQLEAANPTPAPTESPDLLDGDWILVWVPRFILIFATVVNFVWLIDFIFELKKLLEKKGDYVSWESSKIRLNVYFYFIYLG